ncbi:MAG TPA: hypothetical protein VHO06_26340 [Polyangia bacterium]|nr:hypothetical protein [Polyangia bacterium]
MLPDRQKRRHLGPERRGFRARLGGLSALAALAALPVPAAAAPAATPPAAPALNLAAPPPAEEAPPALEPPEEVTPPPPSNVPPLVVTGYVDVGFAKAQGNGTSFPASYIPPDPTQPADYYVDPFAPAVNSRGEAASIAAPPGTRIGGFLPRSANIGGKPSFLINTADVDLRYTAPELPVMIFTRLQVLPRLYDSIPTTTPPTPDTSEGFPAGEYTRLFLEQAFGKISPLPSAELSISLGKFDSVFGIEYLDNEANFRVGVTPSLVSRYTTGQSTGLKVFYRYQIIPAASAVSLNVAATNSGTFVEALQGPSRSLTGRPILSGRLGYELNLPRVSVKVGGSFETGPRNDQTLSPDIPETLYGFDLRIVAPTLVLSGEYVHIEEEDAGEIGAATNPAKLAGSGAYPEIAEFYAHGFWVQAAETLPLSIDPFRLTLYGRYEQRHAQFPDSMGAVLTEDRITGGVNVGIGENLQLKAEYLVNRELSGAPQVANNVFTSSAVWTW